MGVDLTFTVIPESIHMFHSLTALKVKKKYFLSMWHLILLLIEDN